MVAIITGDIIASRKLIDQEKWLTPLKNLFNTWGDTPQDWKLERGDFFQIEIVNPEYALQKALEIKALIKKIEPDDIAWRFRKVVRYILGDPTVAQR